MADCPCEIIQDEPGIANGLYRVILLREWEDIAEQEAPHSGDDATGAG